MRHLLLLEEDGTCTQRKSTLDFVECHSRRLARLLFRQPSPTAFPGCHVLRTSCADLMLRLARHGRREAFPSDLSFLDGLRSHLEAGGGPMEIKLRRSVAACLVEMGRAKEVELSLVVEAFVKLEEDEQEEDWMEKDFENFPRELLPKVQELFLKDRRSETRLQLLSCLAGLLKT